MPIRFEPVSAYGALQMLFYYLVTYLLCGTCACAGEATGTGQQLTLMTSLNATTTQVLTTSSDMTSSYYDGVTTSPASSGDHVTSSTSSSDLVAMQVIRRFLYNLTRFGVVLYAWVWFSSL